MKFGSVKFFKCLILTTIFLMIIIPAAISIFLAVENNRLTEELESLAYSYSIPPDEMWVASLDETFITEDDEIEYSIEYQKLYPDLYAEKGSYADDIKGSAYLTFDDGPSALTSKILKVLKDKNVKATFFVVYDDSKYAADLLRQIAADGHTIGVHSGSHVYKQIYASVENFLMDFEKTATWIEEATGIKPVIFRFPGGSINTYNQSIYQPLIAEMLRRGYVYYDWNVSSGDAGGFNTVHSIIGEVLNGADSNDKAIILMHDNDNKTNTLKALPEIIDRLQASGKLLLPLNNTVKPIVFGYKN